MPSSNSELLHRAYARYQLQWMLDHGYSLEDFAQQILSVASDRWLDNPGKQCSSEEPFVLGEALVSFSDLKPRNIVSDVMAEWITDRGFSGDVFASFGEWCEENRQQLLSELHDNEQQE